MLLIKNISADTKQLQTLVLPDGSSFQLTLYFVPMQLGWFITNLTYGDFVINYLRITNNPNMLRQWKNQIPFGLACFSKGNREPSFIEDFESNNSQLFILTKSEVEEYEAYLSDN